MRLQQQQVQVGGGLVQVGENYLPPESFFKTRRARARSPACATQLGDSADGSAFGARQARRTPALASRDACLHRAPAGKVGAQFPLGRGAWPEDLWAWRAFSRAAYPLGFSRFSILFQSIADGDLLRGGLTLRSLLQALAITAPPTHGAHFYRAPSLGARALAARSGAPLPFPRVSLRVCFLLADFATALAAFSHA